MFEQRRLTVETKGEQVFVYGEDPSRPLLVQNAFRDKRPYIHPILAPDGNGILTEDSPPHHTWQHGLYIGLNDVNGVGFWTENSTDGTFHPEPLGPAKVKRGVARWTVKTAYRAPDTSPVLMETQQWGMAASGDRYLLDLDWSLTGAVDVRFGQYAYGGLFLRMPYRNEVGGRALNSEGQENGAAEGQRANWVAVSMPIEGRDTPAGIAIFDYPTNPEYPNPWRVDGQLGIAPSRCIAGEWHLAQGETVTYRYQIEVFCGDINPDALEETWSYLVEAASEGGVE